MNIEYTNNPNISDVELLTKKINDETIDFGTTYPFGFFIRDDKNNIIAGANGHLLFGAIYTDQLWVHKDYRKSGFGKKIMGEIHEYGAKIGCSMSTVNTMSFQGAKEFYEKLGYKLDFERSGYAKDTSILFMKKDL